MGSMGAEGAVHVCGKESVSWREQEKGEEG